MNTDVHNASLFCVQKVVTYIHGECTVHLQMCIGVGQISKDTSQCEELLAEKKKRHTTALTKVITQTCLVISTSLKRAFTSINRAACRRGTVVALMVKNISYYDRLALKRMHILRKYNVRMY